MRSNLHTQGIENQGRPISLYSERGYIHLLAEAAKAIVEVKARRDWCALTELSKLMKRKGTDPGDKPTDSENRRMIKIFQRLPHPRSLRGGSLKTLALDDGTKGYERRQRVLHVQLKRFCLRAHCLWHEMGRPTRQFWRLPKYSIRFHEGCGFRMPKEVRLLRDAIRVGARYCRLCSTGEAHRLREEMGEVQDFVFRLLEARLTLHRKAVQQDIGIRSVEL
jgi:hypothetical protein